MTAELFKAIAGIKGTAGTRLLMIALLFWLAWRIGDIEKDLAVVKYRLGVTHQGATSPNASAR